MERRLKGVKKCGAGYSGGEWFGKDKILVEKSGPIGDRSDYCIVDLRRNVAHMVGGLLLNRYGYRGGLTAVENTIYAIGMPQKDPKSVNIEKPREEDLVHTGASMLDLTSSPCRWKHLHGGRMVDPDRYTASIVSMGDNIFSFGGTRQLCEFYHTAAPKKKRGWRPFPRPPHDHQVLIPVVTDPLNDRFLCFFPEINSLYACYPYNQDNPWVCLHDDVPKFRTDPFPTVVNDVIYFFRDDLFEAYDIRTNEKLQLIWSSYLPFGPRDIFRYTFLNLLNLGDDILCLPTSVPGNVEDPASFVFFRFSVCRTSPLTATFTPLTVHPIPAPGYLRSTNFLPL